jgi:hypothetical protein
MQEFKALQQSPHGKRRPSLHGKRTNGHFQYPILTQPSAFDDVGIRQPYLHNAIHGNTPRNTLFLTATTIEVCRCTHPAISTARI